MSCSGVNILVVLAFDFFVATFIFVDDLDFVADFLRLAAMKRPPGKTNINSTASGVHVELWFQPISNQHIKLPHTVQENMR